MAIYLLKPVKPNSSRQEWRQLAAILCGIDVGKAASSMENAFRDWTKNFPSLLAEWKADVQAERDEFMKKAASTIAEIEAELAASKARLAAAEAKDAAIEAKPLRCWRRSRCAVGGEDRCAVG